MSENIIDSDTPVSFGIGVPVISAQGSTRGIIENTAGLGGKEVAIFATRYPLNGTVNWANTANRVNAMNPAIGTVAAGPVDASLPSYHGITYSPKAYYSNIHKYDFRMIYPSTLPEGVSLNNTAMTADIDLTKQPDLLFGQINNVSKSYSSLAFRLDHQLACVEFNIKKNSNLDYSIYLNNFNIEGNQNATFDLVTGAFTSFTNSQKKQVVKVSHHDFEISETTNTLICKSLIFPTQNLTSYTFSITISQREYDITIPNILTPPGGGAAITYTKWEAGKKYTYNLIVNDANVHVEFVGLTEQEWDSVPEAIEII